MPGIEIASIRDLTEMQAMLSERIKEWGQPYLQQGIEQGIEQGIGLGEARLLKRLLTSRFGTLPPAIAEQIDQADSADLERWSTRLFEATSLEAVFFRDLMCKRRGITCIAERGLACIA